MSEGGARNWQPVFLSDEFKRPAGAYSPAVRAGDFVFASGQVPRDPRTGQLLGSTVEDQTHGVFDNIRRLLQAAGTSLDNVVSVSAFLADMKDWDAFDAVYRQNFAAPFPARTTIGCQLHDVLVEITVIAKVK
jgi:2-iminobutanoate/2-iminopropanoate deaminase